MSSALFHGKQNFQFISLFLKNRVSLLRIFNGSISTDSQIVEKESHFSHAKHGTFFQESVQLHNPFVDDVPLQRVLKRYLPSDAHHDVSYDLNQFGERIVSEIHKIGWECEQQLPHLIAYDAWGKRVDALWTCNAWKQQRKISSEEGIVAIGYERKFHEWSRLYQIAKLYMYSPNAGLYSCPLAMTDGAAKTIESFGLNNRRFAEAYKRLTTRNHEQFWTSGQWMTERQGGSDVANGTETIAVPDGDAYKLYGYKWFSSATDADMSLTLARIVTDSGTIQGTKGLALFFVQTKDELGKLNNIQMVKLKNKLGTRPVATAELLLDGTVAYKMSSEGQGVAGISHMLTITRIHNAAASVGGMRKMLSLARDYSQKRRAFGKKIGDFPLHIQTLARMEVETRGSLLLLFKVACLLGKSECKTATDEDLLLLRLLTPIIKLYTAKQAVAIASEGLESFGGQGYIEDTGLPVMFRDAQILPIWEGTTNILSLDVLRCLAKTNGEVLKAFMLNIQAMLGSKQASDLSQSYELIQNSANSIVEFAQTHPNMLVTAARDFSYSIARTYIGALLLENASNSRCEDDIIAAKRWCELQDLCPITTHNNFSSYDENGIKSDYELVMKGYQF